MRADTWGRRLTPAAPRHRAEVRRKACTGKSEVVDRSAQRGITV